jgi:hypothetical protein
VLAIHGSKAVRIPALAAALLWAGASTALGQRVSNQSFSMSSPAIANSNATPNPLPWHLEGVIDVKAFGATGNGTTDDTAAIQAAVAAIPPAGAILLFPRGNYLLSGGTGLPSGTTVDLRGSTITAAPAASWPSGAVASVFTSNRTGITVVGGNFLYPVGTANFGKGGVAHILYFGNGASNILVTDNISNGGGDFVSAVGVSGIIEYGNIVTNVDNGCLDHWGGSSNVKVIANYCSTTTGTRKGVGGIWFTGINTDFTPADGADFTARDNVLYFQNRSDGQAIGVNGHQTGGTNDEVVIANNTIFMANGIKGWGILVTGHASNGIIEGNYLYGNAGAYSAVNVFPPATNWVVQHNHANNWQAGTKQIFGNASPEGSLVGNRAPSSSSPISGGTHRTTVLRAGRMGTVSRASQFIVTRGTVTKTIRIARPPGDPVAPTSPRTDGAVTVASPPTGFSSTIPDDCSTYIIATASPLTNGTLTMPRNPSGNRIVRIVSTQEITHFVLSARVGQSIAGTPTKLAGNRAVGYVYNGTAWHRLGSTDQ